MPETVPPSDNWSPAAAPDKVMVIEARLLFSGSVTDTSLPMATLSWSWVVL
ncbi:hypothetical protein D3C85_654870 [compost metagenome]